MQRRKIIVNNDTYETLEAVRKSFRNEVSDDDILMAAFTALARDMRQAINKKGEIKVCNDVSPDSTFEDDISQGSSIGEERALEGFYG